MAKGIGKKIRGTRRIVYTNDGNRFRRNRKNRLRIGLFNAGLNPLPERYVCKMKYAENFIVGSGTSPSSYTYFRLNSLYDPDYTLGGHQPYGYDQISPLFTGYRVYATSWRVTMENTLGETSMFMAVMPIPSANTFTFPSISSSMENPRARYGTYTVGAKALIIKGRSFLPKLAGVPVMTYRADNNYSSAVAGNPVIPLNLVVFVSDPTEATNIPANNVIVNVEIKYHCEFIGTVLQAPS